eukprot:1139377-Pelagomonas_calceolata.AAC.9
MSQAVGRAGMLAHGGAVSAFRGCPAFVVADEGGSGLCGGILWRAPIEKGAEERISVSLSMLQAAALDLARKCGLQ